MGHYKKIIARECKSWYNISMINEKGIIKCRMELKQYLEDVYLLEKQLHIYNEIERKYDKFIQKLKIEKRTVYLYESGERVGKVQLGTNYVMPIPEYKPSYLGERKNKMGKKESVFGFKGAFDMFKKLPKRWWDEELISLEKEEHNKYVMYRLVIMLVSVVAGAIGVILFQMPFIFILMLLVGGGICYYVGDENKREYLPGDMYYEKFMTLYEKKYKDDIRIKEEELTPKIKHVEKEYDTLVLPKLEETKELLEKLYEKNVLDPKYRNYVAVTQLYEYLEMGRCSDLEGACHLYEEEISKDIIVTDLDLSPYQMEKLQGTMNRMMTSLKKEAGIIDKIVDQLYNIEENTTLIALSSSNNSLNKEISNKYGF